MILLTTQKVIENTRKPLELESWGIPLIFWQVINFIALAIIIFLLYKVLIKLSKNK